MRTTIAFDVYGTLVDPLAMADRLESFVGDRAARFAELWRMKQLEYFFRRALMRAYQPFSVCTRDALLYSERALGVVFTDEDRTHVMQHYGELPAFPDAPVGLASLKGEGHFLAAFSNGEGAAVRQVLTNAKLLPFFDDVISTDDVKSFKPDPAVYAHAVERLGQPADRVWLVSSNPFDIIGAKSAGLRTAWVKRNPNALFDPWGIEPDLVPFGIEQLARLIAKDHQVSSI